ncbi:MAG: DEAD/DEAH box helicase family protein [Cyanobacteria bacterium J06641_5]
MTNTIAPPPQPSNPVQLRGTQAKDKAALYERLRKGDRRVLFVAGCGYGKTVLASATIFELTQISKMKVLFVVPAVSLIAKTLATFRRYDIPTGVIHRGFGKDRDESQPCQIALWQTLQNQWPLDWFEPDAIVLDETHEVCFSNWSQQVFPKLNPSTGQPYELADLVLALECLGSDRPQPLEELEKLHTARAKDYANDDEALARLDDAWRLIREQKQLLPPHLPQPSSPPFLIGLTATPFRHKTGEYLGQIFQSQVLTPTPGELVQAGQLVGCSYLEAECPDLTNVATAGGDFNESQLSHACNTPEANAAIVRGYLKHAVPEGRAAFCFAVDVQHVLDLTAAFQEQGVEAVGITAKTPVKLREAWFAQLANGELQVIVNRDTCYRGVDVDSVRCILLGRPTLSTNVHIQQIGRGMRICNDPEVGKNDCLVLDFAGNVARHGRVEDLTYPELQREEPTDKKRRKQQKTKPCPSCSRLLDLWATLCPHCNQDLSKPHLVPTGDLVLSLSSLEKERYEFYREQLQTAYASDRDPAWAAKQLQERVGNKLHIPRVWGRNAVFGPTPTKVQMAEYRSYLERACDRLQRENPKGEDCRDRFIEACLAMEFGEAVGVRSRQKGRLQLPLLAK